MLVSTRQIIRKSTLGWDWNNVRDLGVNHELVADLIVNHISSDSPQFKDFSRCGADSPFNGMFLTYDRIFPTGATEADLMRIYRPRPGLPFTSVVLESGEKRLLWTTLYFAADRYRRKRSPGRSLSGYHPRPVSSRRRTSAMPSRKPEPAVS